jgi:GNAT superfamily N-acetyltransferase
MKTLVTVEAIPLTSPTAELLIAALLEDLNLRYPEPEHRAGSLDPEEFVPPRGIFLVGFLDGKPAGCGGIRWLEEGVAEVKRMYAANWARRNGVARTILLHLEEHAGRMGYGCIRLETGVRQPEAIALYEKAGYRHIGAYGQYQHGPLSVCFEKTLTKLHGAT